MADLTDGRSDRAQILIVSAFALGVLFVALALILNSAIFTENLASRGETTGGDNVIEYQDAIQRGVGDVVTYENENVSDDSTGYGTIADRVTLGTTDLAAVVTRRGAKAGATSGVTGQKFTNGTLIRQTDGGTFEDNDSRADWTLATGVDHTRRFRVNVSRSKLNASSCSRFNSCFTLNVTDGYDWRVSINDEAAGIVVAVKNGTDPAAECAPVDRAHAVVDLTAGTVNGTDCPALEFSETPDVDYSIEYYHSDKIGGNYTVVVDNESIVANKVEGYFYDTANGSPVATRAVYGSNVTYLYQSATVNMTGKVRVAPGETDE